MSYPGIMTPLIMGEPTDRRTSALMAVVHKLGGALPTKGLTLPLMSYGGSSLITVLVLLALILRVDYENRLAAARAARTLA